MSKTESDPTHTETQETTAAVPRGSGPEAAGGRTPQTLWDQLRQELRPPVDAIIGSSELLLLEDADALGQADCIT